MSHSKRNTSRPVFTAHERALAKSAWSSSSARLSRDSFLPFGACGLCLEPARDPVACAAGDVFCRECALANILAQRHEAKRAAKRAERARRDGMRENEALEARVRAEAVRLFEVAQTGADVGRAEAGEQQGGGKRKFLLDEDEVARVAREDRARAKRVMGEQAQKQSSGSPWAPPERAASEVVAETSKAKEAPVCPASAAGHAHPLSLKTLQTLTFSTDAASGARICPSCLKVLGNASRAQLLVACGHVACRACVQQALDQGAAVVASAEKGADAAALACFVCDAEVAGRQTDEEGAGTKLKVDELVGLTELRSEGTGFSARGGSTVEKSGLAFQC